MFRLLKLACAALALVVLALPTHSAPPDVAPPNGLRNNTPEVHALTNARLQLSPAKALERGTIVIRDGRIVAVGRDVEIPKEAKVWDLAGKTIYAGFIDAYSELEIELATKVSAAPYWNANVRPQLKARDHVKPDKTLNAALRSQGITVRHVVPSGAIIDGRSTLISSGDEQPSRMVPTHYNMPLHLHLTTKRGQSRDSYPTSPMGAVALARQAFYDAKWFSAAFGEHAVEKDLPRVEWSDALAELSIELGDEPLLIDAPNEWYFLRGDRFVREFDEDPSTGRAGRQAIMVGSGREYRRLDDIAATGRPIIVPLNFPQPPNVATPEAASHIALASLMHWDIAPENPARLAAAGVKIAFTAHGLKEMKDFLPRVRQAVERGLPKEAALAALTLTPAELLRFNNDLGTLEEGRRAHLVVASGDIFEKETKIEAVWVDGLRYEIDAPPSIDMRGVWDATFGVEKPVKVTLELRGDEKLEGSLTLVDKSGDKIPLKHVGRRDARLSAAFEGEKLGVPGIARLSLDVSTEQAAEPTFTGEVLWSDGLKSVATGRRTGPAPEEKKKEDEKPKIDRKASFVVNYPLGAFGNDRQPDQAKAVAFTHATVWTCDEAGVLEDATVVIENGKITAVGKHADVKLPNGAVEIDCKGKHITPGIIDCHSHMGTDGGINETGQAITAEVRVGDFVDPDDINIYRQLAGGVTTINILHGSANPIGGQNQVCKLRWGSLDEAMKFKEAPQGIKFALGENVKQSNWGERFTSRYPQTRMGVEQLMRDEFAAAMKYDRAWSEWKKVEKGPAPRRDLELEAVAEILRGERLIHCHSYRQDEILALLKLCDDYQIKIATLQHILEGYKVADEIAKRGIGGSAFSDWWAYKVEVYDAIPYNGALMHQQGIVVSFNSDDLELARHLNHEAAKAMKYGGVPPAEALKFVTLNPAKQLKIDQHVGSLAVGKQADLVVWSGSPLAIPSRCEQTWVDGRKYFDIADDKLRRETAKKMHAALVQKILQSGDAMLSPEELDGLEPDLWPRHDEFCVHGHDHDDDHDHEGHDHE